MNLAVQLGDVVMIARGNIIFKTIIGIYTFAIMAAFAAIIPFFSFISVVLLSVSLFLAVLSYILFLSYIAKARNMLAE